MWYHLCFHKHNMLGSNTHHFIHSNLAVQHNATCEGGCREVFRVTKGIAILVHTATNLHTEPLATNAVDPLRVALSVEVALNRAD